MQHTVEVNGRVRQVTVEQREGRYLVRLDEKAWVVDAALVGTHMLSLLMGEDSGTLAVQSREVSLATNPLTGQFTFAVGHVPMPVSLAVRRGFGREADAAEGGSAPQRIVAPMPGKVVRVLARPGDTVVHRQPVIVIEAMKMENELRASRDGTLTDILVQEGQSVEAGTLLAIVTPS